MIVGLLVLCLAVLAGGLLAWILLGKRPICRLMLCEGDGGEGIEFLITDRVATIGSGEGQTVVVSHPRIARRHAVMSLENGEFVLENLSRGGTKVNGETIDRAVLANGDRIRLADTIDLEFSAIE